MRVNFSRRHPSGILSWSVDCYLNGDVRSRRENLKWAIHCCAGRPPSGPRAIGIESGRTLRKDNKIYSTLDISNDLGVSRACESVYARLSQGKVACCRRRPCHEKTTVPLLNSLSRFDCAFCRIFFSRVNATLRAVELPEIFHRSDRDLQFT